MNNDNLLYMMRVNIVVVDKLGKIENYYFSTNLLTYPKYLIAVYISYRSKPMYFGDIYHNTCTFFALHCVSDVHTHTYSYYAKIIIKKYLFYSWYSLFFFFFEQITYKMWLLASKTRNLQIIIAMIFVFFNCFNSV